MILLVSGFSKKKEKKPNQLTDVRTEQWLPEAGGGMGVGKMGEVSQKLQTQLYNK